MMLLPRYSIRGLLALMAASAVFFLVASMAVRGNSVAIAVTLAALVMGVILLMQAAMFAGIWIFATVASILRPGITRSDPFSSGDGKPG